MNIRFASTQQFARQASSVRFGSEETKEQKAIRIAGNIQGDIDRALDQGDTATADFYKKQMKTTLAEAGLDRSGRPLETKQQA